MKLKVQSVGCGEMSNNPSVSKLTSPLIKGRLCLLIILIFAGECFALPSKYDLRDYGRISSVKHQGVPGPCWAFAALSACESNYLTQKLNSDGKIPDLSELHVAFYCYKNPDKKANFSSQHSGTLSLEGNAFMPVALMSRLAAPVDEKLLPYSTTLTDSEKKNLAKKSPESFKRSMRLRDAYFLSGTNALNDTERKNLIINHGAIVVSMYSDIHEYHTKGKFYTYYNNRHGTDINHLVTIAGWDDDFSRENFSPKPSRNGAWLIKNSWGTSRGSNDGYFWLSYDQHTYGGTAFIVEKYNPRLKHYGHDDLGWCSHLNYSWGANIFRISGKREKLFETGFYTTHNNVNYEVYIYDLGFDFPTSPTSGKLIAKTKGNIKYTGYHTIKLPDEIKLNRDKYFSVVLKLSNNIFAVEKKIKTYSENAVINEHESYFSNDGVNWTDGIKLNSNVCIKAFTKI